jgi:hypothetical protein
MNQTLKKQITKLIPETKCFPITLLRIRTASRKDVGLSPYEMLYGPQHLGKTAEIPTMKTKDQFSKNCILVISSIQSFLKLKGLLAQTLSLVFTVITSSLVTWC